MLNEKVTIINALGLHARAAAQLVHLANKFKSSIKIQRADNSAGADAKSILSVLTLAATKGTEIVVTVEGADEEKALVAVKEIFQNGFGEM